MKKTIAVLLSMSMVLALAGCKDKEETTKKKKTKKTTEEIEETEDTEEPGETEDSDIEDPTDTTSDPDDTKNTGNSPDDQNDASFTVTHDLDNYDIKLGRVYRCYGAVDETDPAHTVDSAVMEFYLLEPTLAPDKIYKPVQELIRGKYDQTCILFEGDLKTFMEEEKNHEELNSTFIGTNVQSFRGDGKVLSFRINTEHSYSSYDFKSEYFNLDGQTGEVIYFGDVVKDPQLLADYFKRTSHQDAEEVLEEIKAPYPNFGITSNGIVICGHFVPVIGNEGAFNLEYFNATPSYDYCIWGDDFSRVEWDIDDDGRVDKVDFSYIPDLTDGSLESVIVTWNGQEFEFGKSDIATLKDAGFDGEDASPRTRLFYTENGCFLYVDFTNNTQEHVMIFKLSDGKVTFCDSMLVNQVLTDWAGDDLTFGNSIPELGGNMAMQDYLLDQNGRFTKVSENTYCVSGALVTKVDITGQKLNGRGEYTGETTIATGTKVTISGYNAENGLICLMLLNEDGTEGDRVVVEMSTLPDFYDAFTGYALPADEV